MPGGGKVASLVAQLEIHNSGSRMRKRCRWRFVLQEVQGWTPRRRAVALYVGSAIDRALKAYYHLGSRRWWVEEAVIDPTFEKDNVGPDDWAGLKLLRDGLHDHRVAASWEALNAYVEQSRKATEGVSDVVSEREEDLIRLAKAMWQNYLDWAPAVDGDFEPISMDHRFVGPIATYQDPYSGEMVELKYGGEFDGIWMYQGALYVDENKTSMQPDMLIHSLDRDEQASRYHWALTQMVAAGALEKYGVPRTTPVFGSIFNIIQRAEPTPIKLNQPTKSNPKGAISKQALNNSLIDYLSAVMDQGIGFATDGKIPRGRKALPPLTLDWAPGLERFGVGTDDGMIKLVPFIVDKDMAVQLGEDWEEQHVHAIGRLASRRWVQRQLTTRNAAMLEITRQQLYLEAVDEWNLRQHPETAFRNPTFQCAIDCPVLEPCTAQLRGEPIDGLLAEFYLNRFDVQEMTQLPYDEPSDPEEMPGYEDIGF